MRRLYAVGTGAITVTLVVYACLHLQAAAPAQTTPPAAPVGGHPVLSQYCVSCHNQRLRVAGLMFDKLDAGRVGEAPEVWEKVVRKLRAGQMPPGGSPRPDAAVVNSFVVQLEASLDALAMTRPNPGRPAIHRLNRTEYAYAVKDLLGLDVDVRELLPADDSEHGFDNIAEALTVSPTLVERYLAAARRISEVAIGHTSVQPASTLYPVSESLDQNEQVSDDLPFGSRGGVAVRHHFFADGEYVLRLRLRRTLYDYIRGIGNRHQLDVRVEGDRIALLTFGGEDRGLPPPATWAGDAIADDAWEDYAHHADEHLKVRVPVKAGIRPVAVSFIKSVALSEGVLEEPVDKSTFNYAVDEMLLGNPALASLEISGPFAVAGTRETPSRRQIFICSPGGDGAAEARECATRIISALARRAFRRPVSAADVAEFLRFYDRGRSTANTRQFEAGISAAVVRILIDPEFLFRLERDPEGSTAGAVYRLSDLELASRVSFFLWSSIPDDELLDLAAARKLRQPEILDRQVRRILADPRSTRSLVENFASQWLELRNINSVAPDPAIFPAFSENLRQAMRRETELFIESQIRDDQSVLDLIRANYTYLNQELARHYDIRDVYGPHFRRVKLADDHRRGGLLGHASLLTVTSYANRTSPVLRGAWILDKIFDAPPPQPPPDVPGFPEVTPGAKPQSVRQRLEQHRKNPTCATCHNTIDPMGFALENFDAIGRWRTTNETNLWYEVGTPVDASARLVDSKTFEGLSGLRQVILSNPDQFVAAVSSKLLTYALGRGLDSADMPVIRRIVRDAAKNDYRWSALILGVINSVPFQMRSVGP